jgi:hypothetical protein
MDAAARAVALLANMALQEKATNMGSYNFRVPRLGIPPNVFFRGSAWHVQRLWRFRALQSWRPNFDRIQLNRVSHLVSAGGFNGCSVESHSLGQGRGEGLG